MKKLVIPILFTAILLFSLMLTPAFSKPEKNNSHHSHNPNRIIGNFILSANGTAAIGSVPASLELAGNFRSNNMSVVKEIKLANIKGNLTVGSEIISVVRGEGQVKTHEGKIKIETKLLRTTESRGEMNLKGTIAIDTGTGNVTLEAIVKIQNPEIKLPLNLTGVISFNPNPFA